ncbi:M61 family metallopeptidase, partial [Novosphingobium sp.]|uniref:M61 family metallopeptidase n=1 Tax=Novosphingobium sp. TaxID=1874826 RepID=UPI0035B43241
MIKLAKPANLFLAAIALSASAAALAANSAPQAVPIVQTIPDAVDRPYPGGTILLDIDASDTARSVFRVTQTIPVAAGTRHLTLLYPKWLPGNHSPRGPLAELVDLKFEADGKPIAWRRDPVELYAFHLELPAGTRAVTARFIHTAPLQDSEGRVTITPEIINLQWEKMSLYPAGYYVRQIRYRPTVTFPQGWTAATALDGVKVAGNRWTWGDVAYDTLVDSPIFAGKYFRKWDLGNGVTLNVVADKPDQLAAGPQQIAAHRALVDEALLAFGAKHFDHYEFLLALSSNLGGIGLEHHRSSENQMDPSLFLNWAANEADRDLLPHEFSHSWAGKFRRPARLWTPDYRQPMQDDLLWAYEGQDEFWGLVLSARSGMQSKDMVLGQLASVAGKYSEWPGRRWRSVEDTGFDPAFAYHKPKPYPSIARGTDYYSEGALVWLEIDQIIRAGTGGTKNIEDFARAFLGVRDGDWGELTFEMSDIVATLNEVYPYDWNAFLRARMMTPGQPAPIRGIELGGYKLVWKEDPNPYDGAKMAGSRTLNLSYSLGLTLDREGRVTATQWDSPAFNAGIVTGAKVVAVNGIAYSHEGLKSAISLAKSGGPLQLLVQRGDRFETVSIAYTGGLRWPWIERAAPGTAPTGLDQLLAPKRVGA